MIMWHPVTIRSTTTVRRRRAPVPARDAPAGTPTPCAAELAPCPAWHYYRASLVRDGEPITLEEAVVKRAMFVAVVGCLSLVLVRPGEAQIPASGLSALVCRADIHGNGTYEVGPSGKLVVEVSDDTGSSATVHVIHGGDDSTHQLTYTDGNESGMLDCGDLILTVS
jgi:hypothetical protein